MSNDSGLISKEEYDFLVTGKYEEYLPELEKTLTEPRFTIAELNVTARDATYWDKMGILPELKGKGMRRKYDLYQAVWIKLIQQLRELDVAIKTIKALKEHLFDKTLTLGDVLKNEATIEVLRTTAKEKGYSKELEDLLANGGLDNKTDMEIEGMFESIVKQTVIFRHALSIIILPSGNFFPYTFKKHNILLEQQPELENILNEPHISVSISKAFSDLVTDWSAKPFFNEISLVTEQEKELLKKLRQPDVISAEVIFEGDVIDLIKICKKENVTLAHRFGDVISKNGYHEIVIKTRNGKVIHYQNKILKKLESTS